MLTPLETTNTNDAVLNSNISKLQSKVATTSDADKTKLMKTAQEFEAMFLSRLLNTMDSTVSREDGMFAQGNGEKTFKSFYFQQIASEVSKNPATSIGIAKQIYEQVQGQVEGRIKK